MAGSDPCIHLEIQESDIKALANLAIAEKDAEIARLREIIKSDPKLARFLVKPITREQFKVGQVYRYKSSDGRKVIAQCKACGDMGWVVGFGTENHNADKVPFSDLYPIE